MLRRLRIDNFKSLINVEFSPGPVNLLIGPNNSGKTNLCHALCFLSSSAQEPLDQAALRFAEPWLITNTYLHKERITFECTADLADSGETLSFDYELVVRALPRLGLGPQDRQLNVEVETLKVSGGSFGAGALLLENKAGEVRLLHEGRWAHGEAEPYVSTTAPTNGTMLHRLYDLQHNRAANQFKDYLVRWRYYDLNPSRLRDVHTQTPATLMPDGANFSLVLYQLKTARERDYRRLIEFVREVEPHLDALNFVPPASQDSIVMLMADQQNNLFTLRALSSGTLRFLALAYVLMFETDEPRLILIEEPENGLYVGYLKKLLSLVTEREDPKAQVVFTSHAPYFIDLFDTHLDGVFVAHADETHSALRKPDRQRLEAVLDHFDLGEAHFRGLLQ